MTAVQPRRPPSEMYVEESRAYSPSRSTAAGRGLPSPPASSPLLASTTTLGTGSSEGYLLLDVPARCSPEHLTIRMSGLAWPPYTGPDPLFGSDRACPFR